MIKCTSSFVYSFMYLQHMYFYKNWFICLSWMEGIQILKDFIPKVIMRCFYKIIIFRIKTDEQQKLVGHVPFLYGRVACMFLSLPNASVQAEVIGKRTDRGYHLYGREKAVNWLQKRLKAIDEQLEKDNGNILKLFRIFYVNFRYNEV